MPIRLAQNGVLVHGYPRMSNTQSILGLQQFFAETTRAIHLERIRRH